MGYIRAISRKPIRLHESGCYAIVCEKADRCYIGATKYCGERIGYHIRALRSGDHTNKNMQADFEKWGVSEFAFGVIEPCEIVSLSETERKWTEAIGADRLYNSAVVTNKQKSFWAKGF